MRTDDRSAVCGQIAAIDVAHVAAATAVTSRATADKLHGVLARQRSVADYIAHAHSMYHYES